MRPPADATDYLIPSNSQTNSNYSMATEKTELLSPDTCSTLSCNNEANDHKQMDLEAAITNRQHQNNSLQNQPHLHLPINNSLINPESATPYNIDYLNEQNHFNAEIILNPNLFNNPLVRYVNINVNNSNSTLNSHQHHHHHQQQPPQSQLHPHNQTSLT